MTSLPLSSIPLSIQEKSPLLSNTSNAVPGGTSTFVYGTFLTQDKGICSASAAAHVEAAWQIGAGAAPLTGTASCTLEAGVEADGVLCLPLNVGEAVLALSAWRGLVYRIEHAASASGISRTASQNDRDRIAFSLEAAQVSRRPVISEIRLYILGFSFLQGHEPYGAQFGGNTQLDTSTLIPIDLLLRTPRMALAIKHLAVQEGPRIKDEE